MRCVDLDAGVGLGTAEELELQAQDEVGVLPGGGEELVARHLVSQIAADNRAVLNPEGLRRVALPALEGLAIEQGDGFAQLCRREGKRQDETNGEQQ